MKKYKIETFVSWLLWMRKRNDLNHLEKKNESNPTPKVRAEAN